MTDEPEKVKIWEAVIIRRLEMRIILPLEAVGEDDARAQATVLVVAMQHEDILPEGSGIIRDEYELVELRKA